VLALEAAQRSLASTLTQTPTLTVTLTLTLTLTRTRTRTLTLTGGLVGSRGGAEIPCIDRTRTERQSGRSTGRVRVRVRFRVRGRVRVRVRAAATERVLKGKVDAAQVCLWIYICFASMLHQLLKNA
jgi:hypothetical protein